MRIEKRLKKLHIKKKARKKLLRALAKKHINCDELSKEVQASVLLCFTIYLS